MKYEISLSQARILEQWTGSVADYIRDPERYQAQKRRILTQAGVDAIDVDGKRVALRECSGS